MKTNNDCLREAELRRLLLSCIHGDERNVLENEKKTLVLNDEPQRTGHGNVSDFSEQREFTYTKVPDPNSCIVIHRKHHNSIIENRVKYRTCIVIK